MEMDLQAIKRIVKKLMQEDRNKWFWEPVDSVKLNIPTYPSIIKYPMDLGTIETHLDSNHYSTQEDVANDILLTFDNALRFNDSLHPVHIEARRLKEFFVNKYEELKKKLTRAANKKKN